MVTLNKVCVIRSVCIWFKECTIIQCTLDEAVSKDK